jgi:hypothetical protein
MKYFNIFFIIVILLITGSCQKKAHKIEKNNIIKAMEQMDVGDNVSWIVILPGLGCTGCIQEAEVFMKDHINNEEILFVLTKISSLKILQQKMGIQIKDYQNVIIDAGNEFDVRTENNIYPCIVQLKTGKIVRHEFQSPQNSNAFGRLKGMTSGQ